MAKPKRKVVGARSGRTGTAAKKTKANTSKGLGTKGLAQSLAALEAFKKKAGKHLNRDTLSRVQREINASIKRRAK